MLLLVVVVLLLSFKVLKVNPGVYVLHRRVGQETTWIGITRIMGIRGSVGVRHVVAMVR